MSLDNRVPYTVLVIRKESYKKFEADKFSLLEEVKQVNIGNARSATLSIGLGLKTATYAQSYNYARIAIDLALARGGDQAVIKDCNGITYFGGKKEMTSKNTRVKARVKAEALREFLIAFFSDYNEILVLFQFLNNSIYISDILVNLSVNQCD